MQQCLHDSSRWLTFVQSYTNHRDMVEFAGLLGFVLLVLVTFSLASMVTAGLGDVSRRAMPQRLAHSIVPIVVGYVGAHYLRFFVSNGLQLVGKLGDPFTRGWDLTPFLDEVEDASTRSSSTPPRSRSSRSLRSLSGTSLASSRRKPGRFASYPDDMRWWASYPCSP
jgi:hypothetical protein